MSEELEAIKGGLLESHARLLIIRRAERDLDGVVEEEQRVMDEVQAVLGDAQAASAFRLEEARKREADMVAKAKGVFEAEKQASDQRVAAARNEVNKSTIELRAYQQAFQKEWGISLDLLPTARSVGHTKL